MSYDPNILEVWLAVGVYAGRVLKDEEPANLLAQRLTKFYFVINLKVTKALEPANVSCHRRAVDR